MNQSRVTSGFDLELMLSEEAIKYLLLTSFETGSIPWWNEDKADDGTITNIIIHPPAELETNRLYQPHPDFVPHPFADQVPIVFTEHPASLAVEILPDGEPADVRVQLIVSIIAPPIFPNGGPLILTEQQMHLDAKFRVEATTLPSGLQRDVKLRLELVDIGGPLIDIAVTLPRFDKAKTLANMKEQFDRDQPLHIVGEGGAIRAIASKKFLDDDRPRAMGIFVNLNLKDGPEPDAFLPDRGNLDDAQNFLDDDERFAFGFGAQTYGRLADDIFQRLSEPKDGAPGEFHYPIRDEDDEIIGKFITATVLPEVLAGPGGELTFTGVLVIDVEGEFFIENFLDPNFHFKVRLFPKFQSDGTFTFETDFDLNVPAFGFILAFTALLSIFTLKAALPLFLITLAAKHLVEREGLNRAVPIVERELEEASFLDAMPNRLAIEIRRWDPAYFTHHQIVSIVPKVLANQQGFGFGATDLRIGKQTVPLKSAPIRSEVRDDSGTMVGLLYRVTDWPSFADQLGIIYPAVDRRDFVEIVNPSGVETTRVHLTLEQAFDRVETDRLVKSLAYNPYKVHIKDHQIYQILTMSQVEIPEIQGLARRLLRGEIISTQGTSLRAEARTELEAELGRPPTDEEVNTRFDAKVAAKVDAGAAQRYRRERERFLKLDLEPFEYAHLQTNGVLFLEHFTLEIIKMRDSVGGTVYYRDVPDADLGDNLLKIPRYISEEIVRT